MGTNRSKKQRLWFRTMWTDLVLKIRESFRFFEQAKSDNLTPVDLYYRRLTFILDQRILTKERMLKMRKQ